MGPRSWVHLVLWCEGWTGGGWLRGPLGSAEAQPGRRAAGMWDSLLPGLPAAPGGQDFSSQFCPHSHCPEQAPRPVCGAHVLHSHPFSCPCARGFTHGCKGHPRAHGDITLSQWISVEWATHWPTWTHAHTRAHTFPHGGPRGVCRRIARQRHPLLHAGTSLHPAPSLVSPLQ